MTANNPAHAQDINIHGFISQGYLQSTENNYFAETKDGTFQFNEMGINFTTFVTQDLKVGCQFFARDLGAVGNDEVTINWAFGEYTYKNWLGMRAGLVKIPYGLYNDLRDIDSLRTAILLPSSVYNESTRDGFNSIKGIELFGSIPIAVLGMLQYQILYGENQRSLDSGTVLYAKKRSGFDDIEEFTTGKSTTGRLIWSPPLDGLRIGASALTSSSYMVGSMGPVTITSDIDPTYNYVFSLEYIYGNLKFSAENAWSIYDGTIRIDGAGPAPIFREEENDTKESFYAGLGYRFLDWFEAAYYYSHYVANKDAEGDDNELNENCLSLRFDINPYWLVKLEAHAMDGLFGVESAEDDGSRDSDWMLFAMKISYLF